MLVDTSVWIAFFQGAEHTAVRQLKLAIQQDQPLFLCPTILQEVLQGVREEDHFKELLDYFGSFPMMSLDPTQMAIDAAKLYRKLRKKGVTIRKSNDCLIAAHALRSGLEVLHIDRDFDRIFSNIE